MRRIALAALAAAWLSAPSAQAQVTIDTTRVTCADYLAMLPGDSVIFSAWMSGWFNQKTGSVTVDLEAFARNVANVRQWCSSNPQQTVMAGLQRATSGK